MGGRHAAVEGARAAVAGLSTTERTALAQGRAQAVIGGYGTLLAAGGGPVVTAGPDAAGTFRVRVHYDTSGSPTVRYEAFKPMHFPRSGERRVGKECVSTWRSGWSPDH